MRAPLLALFTLAALIIAPLARAAEAATPVGRWTTIDDETHKPRATVRIWEDDGVLHGQIERLYREPGEDPDPKCTHCDGDRKDQRVIGMEILWDLRRDGDEWNGGRILDPKNGKVYHCRLTLGDDGDTLNVRGYIGIPLLGRTQKWLREE